MVGLLFEHCAKLFDCLFEHLLPKVNQPHVVVNFRKKVSQARGLLKLLESLIRLTRVAVQQPEIPIRLCRKRSVRELIEYLFSRYGISGTCVGTSQRQLECVKIGPNVDRFFIAFERRLEVPHQSQYLAFVVMSRKRARIELQCPIDRGERLSGLLPPDVQHGEIDEPFSERWGERSHLEQHLLALVELSLIKINRGEIRIRRMNVGLQGERLLILTDGVRNTLRILVSLPEIEVRTRLRRGLRYGIFPKSGIVREDRVARDGHECKGHHDAGSHSQPQVRPIPAHPLNDPPKDQSDSQTRNICAVLQNNIGQWNRYICEKWRNHSG